MNGEAPPSVGPYLAHKLRGLDGRLAELIPRVLASNRDDEAVHDLRVALRRTRTILEVGRPVLGRFHCNEVLRAFRDVQRATGSLRDEEVLLQLVRSLGVDEPSVEAWLGIRERRERLLRRALVRAIEAGQLDRGRRLLGALLAFRVDPARDRRLTKFGRRAVGGAWRRVDERRAAPPDDPQALHDLRIAHKRLRYVVETFAEALPSDLAALAQPAARLQSRLGAVHDIDVATVCVRRARSLSRDAQVALLAALRAARGDRIAAYAREAGLFTEPAAAPAQAVGGEGLRKTSTR